MDRGGGGTTFRLGPCAHYDATLFCKDAHATGGLPEHIQDVPGMRLELPSVDVFGIADMRGTIGRTYLLP